MAKNVRAYSLPTDLLERVDMAAHNRSDFFRQATKEAHDDPAVVVQALGRRLDCVSPPEEVTQRVGLASTDEFLEHLNALAHALRLPVEHVLRLSLEALLFKRGF